MGKKISIIVGVLAVLAITGVLLFVLLSGNGSPDETDSSQGSDPSKITEEGSTSKSEVAELPSAVPKVMIFTAGDVNPEFYVGCTVRIYEDRDQSVPVIEDKDATFKIRGNSTSSGDKKPYNIKFSQKTDVFGFGANTKWSLLANCFDPTLIRNQAVYDFASSAGLDYTPSYRVVEVYVNGRFQGSYLFCDSIDVAEDRVDIDNEGNEYIIEYDVRNDWDTTYITTPLYRHPFGIREPEEPTRDQMKWLEDYLNKAESALYGGNYERVKDYFDIDSMVNFYIVNELFKNVDIEIGSTYFYIKDGRIHGGPVWDFDLSSGNCSYEYFNYYEYNNINGQGNGSGNSWEGIYCNEIWFAELLEYPEFYNAVTARYAELQPQIVNLYEDNSLSESYIDRVINVYGDAFQRNYSEARWNVDHAYCEYQRIPDGTFEENVEYFRDWLKKRNEWLLNEWNI